MCSIEGFGQNAKRERKRLAMSQRSLAKAAGLSQATLSRIEAGLRQPSMPESLAISWALQSTLEELLGDSERKADFRFAARSDSGAMMDGFKEELTQLLELHQWLDDQAIPRAV